MTQVLWHPHAKRVIIPGAVTGTMVHGCKPKAVLHTTEGETIGGAQSAYVTRGNIPHFTIAHVNGKRVLWQHAPLDASVSALKHPDGTPDTNRAECYQVEIVGFAADSAAWSSAKYHYLNLLAVWLHRHTGVPLSTPVAWRNPTRIHPRAFAQTTGFIGHMHVPNNDHTDPGRGFHIGKVLHGVK